MLVPHPLSPASNRRCNQSNRASETQAATDSPVSSEYACSNAMRLSLTTTIPNSLLLAKTSSSVTAKGTVVRHHPSHSSTRRQFHELSRACPLLICVVE